jgi:hypothetical protein
VEAAKAEAEAARLERRCRSCHTSSRFSDFTPLVPKSGLMRSDASPILEIDLHLRDSAPLISEISCLGSELSCFGSELSYFCVGSKFVPEDFIFTALKLMRTRRDVPKNQDFSPQISKYIFFG